MDCQQYELMDVQDSATDNFTGPTSHSNTQLPQPPMPHMPVNHNNNPKNLSLFAREVIWTPHAFDLNNSTTATTTTNAIPQYDCPTGGPGGLICCHACAEKYSQFLTETIRDIETAKMQCGGREVQELLDMTKSAKETLARTIKVARRKPVPMRKQPKLQQLPQQQHSLNSTTSQNQRSPLPAENIVENLNASIADHQMLLGDELLQVAEV